MLHTTWLPKRHRVGPSASLDEYRTIGYCKSVSQASSHVNFVKGVEVTTVRVFAIGNIFSVLNEFSHHR